MRYLELFAGAGGLALGVELAGFENAGCIEKDKQCCATLRLNRPDWTVYEEDITKFDFSSLADSGIDLLTFGFPCQPFSYAGRKEGIADTRGTLFYDCARALKELKPKAFIAENVKGLLTHDKGRTYSTIKRVLEDQGYDVQEKVLCASFHGVAQRRKRLFIIGFRKDLNIKNFTYPEPEEQETLLKEVLTLVPESIGAEYNEIKKELYRDIPAGGCWHSVPYEKVSHYIKPTERAGGGTTGMLRRLSYDKPSPTILTTITQKRTEFCHPEYTRPLTTRECARIQSFPDTWQFTGSLANQYKQIGNAVPPLMACRVATKVREALEGHEGMRNTLFVFEGLDGSGKTTLIQEVAEVLNELGYKKVLITKEPGGCPENIALRDKLCNPEKRLTKKEEEAVLWVDYYTHRHFYLTPKMRENNIILCDRHILYSNLVYQVSNIEGMDSRREELLKKGVEKPRAAFLLNTPPEICRERISIRQEEQSVFDKEDIEVYKDRYRRYRKMLKYSEVIEIDWQKPLHEQAKQIARAIIERI